MGKWLKIVKRVLIIVKQNYVNFTVYCIILLCMIFATFADRADPVFDSCPGTMFVDMYAPIKYEEPKPSDNTAVYMFEVSPENFQPDTVVDAALRVRYRAVDYAGLASHCDIWIYLTGKGRVLMSSYS